MYGPIPTYLGLLTQLNTLHLGSNALFQGKSSGFQGTIPTEIGLLTLMRKSYTLDLQIQRRSPTIIFISGFLYFENNALAGTIPSEIGLMSDLLTLKLQQNFFNGDAPQELCELMAQNDILASNVMMDCISKVNCSCCQPSKCF